MHFIHDVHISNMCQENAAWDRKQKHSKNALFRRINLSVTVNLEEVLLEFLSKKSSTSDLKTSFKRKKKLSKK